MAEAAGPQDEALSQLWGGADLDQTEEAEALTLADEEPEVPEFRPPQNGDLVQLVALFTSLLHQTESRILEGMRHATGQLGEDLAANSAAAKERWAKHETEHAAERLDWQKRWEAHITEAERRWTIEDQESVKFDARVQPVRATIQWVWSYRKDIIIILLGIFTLLGLSASWWLS